MKHEQEIDCGGGYLKVFDCKLDQKDMHGESPYEIMFGPDICGPGTKKVSLSEILPILEVCTWIMFRITYLFFGVLKYAIKLNKYKKLIAN